MDLFLFKLTICEFEATKIFKRKTGIAPNVFPNILIPTQCPLKSSVKIIGLDFS